MINCNVGVLIANKRKNPAFIQAHAGTSLNHDVQGSSLSRYQGQIAQISRSPKDVKTLVQTFAKFDQTLKS